MYGSHLIKSWSKSQAVIALSSAEAELYSAVKVSCESMGFQSMLSDFGIHARIETSIDASAALGVIKRKGLGKLRHIRVQQLWIQDASDKGLIKYHKIDGKKNPANTLTKHVSAADIEESTKYMNGELRKGRSEIALSA